MNKDNKNKMNKKSGFKVPKNYFESIEDAFFDKLKLDKSYNESGFKVPENYFESVEDQVFEKLNLDKELPQANQKKVISLRDRMVKRYIPMAIAASFLIFLGIIYVNNQKLDFDKLAQNDIEIWMDENIDAIDSYTIANIYNDDALEAISNINDDDLIDYLEDEDLESIINESL